MKKTEKRTRLKSSLAKEFDRQVNCLAESGFPAVVGMSGRNFREYMSHAREVAGNLNCNMRYSLPFLVIPNLSAPLSLIAELIVIDGKKGSSVLDEPMAIRKSIFGPYILTEVDDGSNIKTADNFHEYCHALERDVRRPLSTQEGLILGIVRPDFLQHHAVALQGCFTGGHIKLLLCDQRKCADLSKAFWSNKIQSYKWKVPSFKDDVGGVRINTLDDKVIIASLRNRMSTLMT